jgi:hypothetical protein
MIPKDGSCDEVISLIRFSTAEQVAEGKAGVEGQRSVNRTSAAYHGVKIRREIVVVDVSGRHVKDDPQFQELFEELKDPTLSGVLVPEQSRIVRPETFDDWPILGHFQRNRKLIYTPTGRIDPNTPEGRIGAHRRPDDERRGADHAQEPFRARQANQAAGGQARRRQSDAA